MKIRESLEGQTMNMAKNVTTLFRENPFYSDGEPVDVVIADSTIGRAGESTVYADKFRRAGVDITPTVTLCWCCGVETMDMDPHTIKGVWGSNGAERSGAIYFISVLAVHAQKGSLALGIYEYDVQDTDDTSIPEDAKGKFLRFGRTVMAAATMRGRSYLRIGSICMGIGGPIIDPTFIGEHPRMRAESVDEMEPIRRMSEEIYDKEEFEKVPVWTKVSYKGGSDKNPPKVRKTREQRDRDWEFVVKMMCIIEGLVSGSSNLPEGRGEEWIGHNATVADFQGQRRWTDFYPNGDLVESMLNSSLDWNGTREPYILTTKNDTLGGLRVLFMKLLTSKVQIFTDTRMYQGPEAVKKAVGYDLGGVAKEADGFLHLINSGVACLGATGKALDEGGQSAVKPWYEVMADDQEAMMEIATWSEADFRYFKGSGYLLRYVIEAQMPCTMIRLGLVKGLGPMLRIAEGWTVKPPDDVTDILWKRTGYTWPCTWSMPGVTDQGAFTFAYDVMNSWGANHGTISYGHIRADLITLCSILRIPVSMYNVPERGVFRPAA